MAINFEQRARARGNFQLVGKEAGKPAVIESFVDGKNGTVTIKFKKLTWKVPDPQYSCSQSNRIDHYELSNDRITPHYQQDCRVTKMRWRTVTYQEAPIVVPKEEKKLLRVGEWPEIEVNSDEPGDAAVINVFQVAGQAKGKQVAFQGVRVD
jgi:hypothetical protein